MNLINYCGKKGKIELKNKKVFQGLMCDYTNAQDNEDNQATICIGDYEFKENEIKSIEIIK